MHHLHSDWLSLTPLKHFKRGGTSKENSSKQPETGERKIRERRLIEPWSVGTHSYLVALYLFLKLYYCLPVIFKELQCRCFSALVFFPSSSKRTGSFPFIHCISFILCRKSFSFENVTLRCDNENTLMYKRKNGCKMLFHLLVCRLFFYTDE